MLARTPLCARSWTASPRLRSAIAPIRSFSSSRTRNEITKRIPPQPSNGSGRAWNNAALVLAIFSLSTFALSRTTVHSDAEDQHKRPMGDKGDLDPNDVSGHPDESPTFPHPPPTSGLRVITKSELAHHNTEAVGYWIAIEGQVYDLSGFIESGAHPGGNGVLKKHAGADATGVYGPIHPKGTIEENLDEGCLVGMMDPSEVNESDPSKLDEDELRIKKAREEMMGVDGMVSLDDFETLARKILSPAALAYYESGSDDEWTLHENNSAYRRIRFRPRVMRRVKEVDTSTEILGVKTSVPFFIAPAALAKLGHPDGEVNLTKGAGETGIVQVISSNASCSLEEMVDVKLPDQTLMWQYYVAADRVRAEKSLRKALDLGMQSIWVTVDAPVGGKRERDMKEKIARDPPARDAKREPSGGSTSAAQFAYVDPDLNWEDIAWIKKIAPGKPIVIKGISCVEDAVLALEHGCEGIVLSNHGGRQLDGARAPIEVLQEIKAQRPDLCEKLEIYVDGGIRRGTDVLKALCLGAKAVGVGRPFLYAQSAYGVDGVVKAYEILQEEVATGMRLLGVKTVEELKPTLVDCLPLQ